jgi:hypothetical protein
MICIHCGGRIEADDLRASEDSVLAALVSGPGYVDAQRPALCRNCLTLVASDGERRAEFYCLWCGRPLAADGKTPRNDATLLPTDSDACVLFRECRECTDVRRRGESGRPVQPRPR